MNSALVTIIGLVICTGPLWGGAIGYALAIRGWRVQPPFRHDIEEEV